MGLFKKEKKQEETKMVRTQEKKYDEDDEMEQMDDSDDFEDEEPDPEFKPRSKPPVKIEQLKKAVRSEPQQEEPKIVEVAVNLELLNNKLNYLIAQNNEIIKQLKR